MSDGKMISITSVAGNWEYIYISTERGAREVFAEPVIAWGLTETGIVQPVTATGSLTEGIAHALRNVEDGRIFDTNGQHQTREEWLKSVK